MQFTAMIRAITLPIEIADARLDGIDLYGYPITGYNRVETDGSYDFNKLYLQHWDGAGYVSAAWLPDFELGGGNLIVTSQPTSFTLIQAGSLVISSTSIPNTMDGIDSNLIVGAAPGTYFFATWSGTPDLNTNPSEYHKYTAVNGVVKDEKYSLTGSGVSGGHPVNTTSFDPGTVTDTRYFIQLAIPLDSANNITSGNPVNFIIMLQSPDVLPIVSSDAIDLRRYIANMTWTTAIDKGYDTATVNLNEAASSLGKYFSYLIGQNCEIIDIYGNVCYNGIISNIYVDGTGGRIDCIGYKATMAWFKFDQVYLAPDDGWDADNPGPTTPQVLYDVMEANPYMQRGDGVSNVNVWRLNGAIGYYADDVWNYVRSWHEEQLVATSSLGLDNLDFSDGSHKCADVIELLESFGYAYSSISADPNQDGMYVQCWANGYAEVLRVFSDVTTLRSNYVITRQNIQNNSQGLEISSDINDIFTETYTIYNDSNGENNVSTSSFNIDLARKYGFRLRIETTDFGPSLAAQITKAGKDDHSKLIGIGAVAITGNVKGGCYLTGTVASGTHHSGSGGMANIPCYLMRAGRIVEIEDNIGYGSIYRNKSGTPGIFYIGSTTFSTDTGVLSLTPATTFSAIDMIIKRQSSITN